MNEEEHNYEGDDFLSGVEDLVNAMKEGIVRMAKAEGRDVIEMEGGMVIISHEDQTSDQHEDHLRFAALHRTVTTKGLEPDQLTDGDKCRAVAWRMMILSLENGHCVHLDMPWDLVDIADRLDMMDMSEGVAS